MLEVVQVMVLLEERQVHVVQEELQVVHQALIQELRELLIEVVAVELEVILKAQETVETVVQV